MRVLIAHLSNECSDNLLAGEYETLVVCGMRWCPLLNVWLVVAWESMLVEASIWGDQRTELLSHYGNNRDFRDFMWADRIWSHASIHREKDNFARRDVLERAQE